MARKVKEAGGRAGVICLRSAGRHFIIGSPSPAALACHSHIVDRGPVVSGRLVLVQLLNHRRKHCNSAHEHRGDHGDRVNRGKKFDLGDARGDDSLKSNRREKLEGGVSQR